MSHFMPKSDTHVSEEVFYSKFCSVCLFFDLHFSQLIPVSLFYSLIKFSIKECSSTICNTIFLFNVTSKQRFSNTCTLNIFGTILPLSIYDTIKIHKCSSKAIDYNKTECKQYFKGKQPSTH